MRYKIYATSTAQKETTDAVINYENAQPGLGLSFLDEIEDRYDAISRNPFAYDYIDDKNIVRDVLVERFPFVIIYKVESDILIILSVHHTRKIPEY